MSYISLRIPEEAVKPVKEAFERERRLLRKKLQFYEKRLESFEKEYKMSSEEFQRRFNRGEIGDDKTWFEWLFALKVYNQLKERLSALEGVKLD
ncbi:MAG: hypothetical protein GXO66_06990 [Euryarchaeota archaeon]|nr:hypothetical protein [Euryarchaeota archaeon]